MSVSNFLTYYPKRIKQLGPTGLARTLMHRCKKRFFIARFKNKALKGTAGHIWSDIQNDPLEFILSMSKGPRWLQRAGKKKEDNNFDIFFHTLKTNVPFDALLSSPLFKALLPPDYACPKTMLKKAMLTTQATFDILGSGPHHFDPNNILWHHDFKHQATPPAHNPWQNSFYGDLTINSSTHQNNVSPDIKVPWELSRLQHIFILGTAYQNALTQDALNNAQLFAHTFQNQVSQWINHNPYLIGVNWVCPMEVALRAIN
ncbi:MAG: hypothetical protein ACHQVK_01010, partial [Candidatus Paceibacterales bacterium]